MKHLIMALCAFTLIGLTAQANVILHMNGVEVGNQWGGGYVNGPGMATWNSCQFNGSGECVRDGDTLNIQTLPNSVYWIDLIPMNDIDNVDFGFHTDASGNFSIFKDGGVAHVEEIDGEIHLIGTLITWDIQPAHAPCCSKIIGGAHKNACNGQAIFLPGDHTGHFWGWRDSCGGAATGLTTDFPFTVEANGISPDTEVITVPMSYGGDTEMTVTFGPLPPPQGEQGETGETGEAGAQGPQGKQGPAGADSTVAGPAGPAGPAGTTGADGSAGATGADGAAAPCVDCAEISQAAFDLACKLLALNPPSSVTEFRDCVDAIATVSSVGSGGNICPDSYPDAESCSAYIDSQVQGIFDSKF